MEFPKIPGGPLGKIAAIAIPTVAVSVLVGKFIEWVQGKKADEQQPAADAQPGMPVDPTQPK